ncbi:alpha-galactosidase [Paenibacillus selenitireducens]|uniref:Alpha-galactosidase n=1 Tax=Paenibacillus selenitireducens TaxID=1324314 RepID=A0A1T2X6Z9_9BACL|nr:glycoside hydrolase family 27 protein [Paenibacillus selenitireducens]OPA75595.1 alpha-galactosidase [Paenibacillus selenitireducens]
MNFLKIANTPPMGWNSWDCYGASVREDEIRGNAAYMAEHLQAYGWEYVVVDIQWYEPGANSSQYRPFVPLEMDEYARLMPAVNRFPSAIDGNGFAPLAAYVHSLGLKFGIHIMRGIPRQAVHANTPLLGTTATARDIAHTNSICPWNTDMYGVDASKPGAQEYYNSLFQLYASWGVDFVKVDDIAASRLYDSHLDEIQLIRHAIDQCGRDMVLSLSPGPAPIEYAETLMKNANMWRMTDDYWDHWSLLLEMFDRCEQWYPHVEPGNWPDADMLPLGHIGIRSVDGSGSDRWTRFTQDEQRTMMTLWCIFRSPLMFGGELRDNDDWTLSLLNNEEVITVLRESHSNRPLLREGQHIAWTAKGPNDTTYLALFNVGDEASTVTVTLDQLGLSSPQQVRDLWTREDLSSVQDRVEHRISAHGSMLLQLR